MTARRVLARLRPGLSIDYGRHDVSIGRRLTFDITGWRGFIAPVRVDGWVGRHSDGVAGAMVTVGAWPVMRSPPDTGIR